MLEYYVGMIVKEIGDKLGSFFREHLIWRGDYLFYRQRSMCGEKYEILQDKRGEFRRERVLRRFPGP